MSSLFEQHKSEDLRKDKLPYQQGCALMAIAQTERKSTNQVLSEMKREQGLKSGKDLQYDTTLLNTLGKRGYAPLSKGMMTWESAQQELRKLHAGGKGKGTTRYFAMTFPPGVDSKKGDSVGHAVSVSVSKSGAVTVFANNSDRDKTGKWVGDPPSTTGVRPFQSKMKPNHQIQLFKKL